ncbi:MAG: hypothetical protein WDM78_24400 [Puia sp.]
MLGLSTGKSPLKLYAELIRMHKEEGLSFKNVVAFNLDEYYPIQRTARQRLLPLHEGKISLIKSI